MNTRFTVFVYILYLGIWEINFYALFCFMSGKRLLRQPYDRENLIEILLTCLVIAPFILFSKKYPVLLPVLLICHYLYLVFWFHKRETNPAALNREIQRGGFLVILCLLMMAVFIYAKSRHVPDFFELIRIAGFPQDMSMQIGVIEISSIMTLMVTNVSESRNPSRRPLDVICSLAFSENIIFAILLPLNYELRYTRSDLVLTIVYIMDICILFYYVYSLRLDERERKMKHDESGRYSYYLNLEREHQEIRRLYHDMKNQIMILREGKTADPENTAALLERADKKIEENRPFAVTGCEDLDILLYTYHKKAEEEKIRFETAVEYGCLTFMKPEDRAVIFENAINNAFEACERMTDGDRYIMIRAGINAEDVVISFRNSVSEAETVTLTSRKQNKVRHGIGLKSISDTAKHYNGYVSVTGKENYFRLTVLCVGAAKGRDPV